MLKSFFSSLLILFCAAIIESSILANINFLLVVPDIILICSIYFSLLNGRMYGEVTGFCSGLFLDFVTGCPFGFNSIFRTLIGYLFGLFSKNVIISGLIVPMLSTGIGTILKRILVLLVSLFYPKLNLHIYGFVTYEFLFEFVINILLSPIIFKILGFFKNIISIRDEKDMIDDVK